MRHEYTRQRQGRDFLNPSKNQQDEQAKKTLAQRLEHFKEEAERNAAPIDGSEPPEKRGLQK
jgi:hypothetical protein